MTVSSSPKVLVEAVHGTPRELEANESCFLSMINLRLLFLLVFFSVSVFLGAQDVTGEVKFEIRNIGLNVTGAFTVVSAKIQFDPTKLSQSVLEGQVKVESIDTGIGKRDRHLMEESYFDNAHFPEIAVQGKSVKKLRDNAYLGRFSVTIKGQTQEEEIIFTAVENNNGDQKFSGEFELNRLDYGVGGKSLTMSNTVKLKLHFVKAAQ